MRVLLFHIIYVALKYTMVSFLSNGLKETQFKARIAYMLYKMLLDIDMSGRDSLTVKIKIDKIDTP